MSEIHRLTQDSELFPPLLREIPDPPQELFVRGNSAVLSYPHLLAVVGSRRATPYGRLCVQALIPDAARAGIVIVSGLAYGIDSLAHQASVEAHRPTIAVLGCGVDDNSIYPKAHINLAHRIVKDGGAVISEYPPGTPAYPSHFPERNRIIAGLCQATLLIQAARLSGTLITARLALEANREVCVVPGAINDAMAAGTNALLRDGAAPILKVEDIFHIFGLTEPARAPIESPPLDDAGQRVMAALSGTPVHVDDLLLSTGLSISNLTATLGQLELVDIAEHVGGMRYVAKNKSA